MHQSANIPDDEESITEKLRPVALQIFDSYLGANVIVAIFFFISSAVMKLTNLIMVTFILQVAGITVNLFTNI